MPIVSTNKFLLWKDRQILKGGNYQSLLLLLDIFGGLTENKINLIKLKKETKINVKRDLDFIEKIWEDHLQKSKPIQHLTGWCYWRDLKLEVSNKVLIPRSETELIVEIVSEVINKKLEKKIFADLGTGSGAISIALTLANPNWEGLATDIDLDALEVASRNFENCSKLSNLKFYCGSWWNPLKNFKGNIDFAISNPPYIPRDVYKQLPKEVKNFEPKIALLGGEDGLEHIKQIIQNAPHYLKEKGWLFLENHYDQSSRVKLLFQENGFKEVKIIKDLSGIGRFTIGRYK